MPVYQLVLESKDRWENVDQGHHMNTALEQRGAMVCRRGSGLEWTTLKDAREAARWLASTYPAGDPVEAICVVAENANGEVLLRAKVRKLTRKERRAEILKLARQECDEEGVCEIDDDAKVSEGDDNGAYVQAWVWVSFAGTAMDNDGAA